LEIYIGFSDWSYAFWHAHSNLRPSRIRNEYITSQVFEYVEIENPFKGSQAK